MKSRLRCFSLFLVLAYIALADSTYAATQTVLIDYARAQDAGDVAALERSLNIILTANPEDIGLDPQGYHAVLLDIGTQRLAVEDFLGSERAYKRALAFAAEISGPASLDQREALRALAEHAFRRGKTEDMQAYLERSLSIAEEELGPENPSLLEEIELLIERGREEDRAGYRRRRAILEEKADLDSNNLTTLSGNQVVDQCSRSPDPRAYQKVQVFYGTNRVPTGARAPSRAYRNTYDETGELHYGSAFVNVPCRRDISAIPARHWFRGDMRRRPANRIVFEYYDAYDDDDTFWQEAGRRMAETDRKEALVYIHGFATGFPLAVKNAARMAVDFELNGAPFIYDWPSRASMLSYGADRDLIILPIIEQLAEFLRHVARNTGARHVTVVAHSLGNEFLLAALKELAACQCEERVEVLFDEVVFAAPDVNFFNFQALVQRTRSIAKRMTVYVSEKDVALQIASWNASARRAGDADGAFIAQGVETIDTTNASTGLLGHSDFIGNALDDFRGLVWHALPPKYRCVLQETRADGGRFWSWDPQCPESAFKVAIIALRRLGPERGQALIEAQLIDARQRGASEQVVRWEQARDLFSSLVAGRK